VSSRAVAVVGAPGPSEGDGGDPSPAGFPRRLAAPARLGQVRRDSPRHPWGEVEVEDLGTADPAGIEVALFSAGAARAREHAPRFAAAGAVVVDNSSAWRMDRRCPWWWPGSTTAPPALTGGSSPTPTARPWCCSWRWPRCTGPSASRRWWSPPISPSRERGRRHGRPGRRVGALPRAAGRAAARRVVGPGGETFARPIGYNVLPLAGSLADRGYTDEEWKLVQETRKILDAPQVAVEPTCVRVPVMVGHGLSASCWFSRPLGPKRQSGSSPRPGRAGVADKVPTPLDCAGLDDVWSGGCGRPWAARGESPSGQSVTTSARGGPERVQIAELVA